jgi:hypothetical protein
VDEACELAADGVVSLLPQGRFPWAGDPSGGAADVAAIEAEVGRLRSGLDLLAGDPTIDPSRLRSGDIADDRIDCLRTLRSVDPIERIGEAAPAAVLFQFARSDFYIAPMTGLEFRSAAAEDTELLSYDDADHAMRLPGIRADRRAFLQRHLDLTG